MLCAYQPQTADEEENKFLREVTQHYEALLAFLLLVN